MAHRLVHLLEDLRKYFYRGPLKYLFRTLGIERSLREFYSKTLSILSPESIIELSVEGTTLQFISKTGLEVQRFQNVDEEQEVLKQIIDELREGDVFYDIGANVGMYSCFVASEIPKGRVIAFEPHPVNAQRLEENARLNGLESAISIRQEALGADAGTAELAVTGSHQAGDGTHVLSHGEDRDTISVDLRTVDGLVDSESIPKPTIVKIDVEGAELEVLRGFDNLFETDELRVIYCEIHSKRIEQFGDSTQELEQLLIDAGFSLDHLGDRGNEEFIRASK